MLLSGYKEERISGYPGQLQLSMYPCYTCLASNPIYTRAATAGTAAVAAEEAAPPRKERNPALAGS